jgi:hypothetical protein
MAAAGLGMNAKMKREDSMRQFAAYVTLALNSTYISQLENTLHANRNLSARENMKLRNMRASLAPWAKLKNMYGEVDYNMVCDTKFEISENPYYPLFQSMWRLISSSGASVRDIVEELQSRRFPQDVLHPWIVFLPDLSNRDKSVFQLLNQD